MNGASRRGVLLAVLGGLLVVSYPLLVGHMIDRFGIRTGVLGFLAYCLPLELVRRRSEGSRLGPAPVISIAALTLLAAVFEDRFYLLLFPAGINLILLGVFARSLRGPESLVEQIARRLEPLAPEFIRSYCRKVTMVWCAFFLVNAAVIAALAATARDAWRSYTTWQMWVAMGALMAGEFLVRKWWFRYYFYGGPFDRAWAALFPAENTAIGRRSLEYIRQTREKLKRGELRDLSGVR